MLSEYDKLNTIPFKFPFRLGRKQSRAILDADSKEVVLFPVGSEEIARITVMMWNDWHKNLCIAWNVKCDCSYCK